MSVPREDNLTKATEAVNRFMQEGLASQLTAKAISEIDAKNLSRLKRATQADALGGSVYFLLNHDTSADAFNHAIDRLASDSRVQHKAADLAAQWRTAAIDRMGAVAYIEACGISREDMLALGKEECIKLLADRPEDIANTYVRENAYQTILDRLAKEKAPKSSLDYVMHKAIDNSLLGLLNSENSGSLNEAIKNRAEKIYGPSAGERVGARASAAVIDTLIFLPAGAGASALAGKGVAATASVLRTSLAIDGTMHAGLEWLDQRNAKGQIMSKQEWEQYFANCLFGNPYALSPNLAAPDPASAKQADDAAEIAQSRFEDLSQKAEAPTKGVRL